MLPTPRHMPLLTAGLLAGGMGIFILKDFFSVPLEKVFAAAGMAVFLAGLVVALVGMIWSIRTLANPALRRARGITTPLATILIAVFAWSGALLTLYKFKTSHDVRLETNANVSTETAREAK